MLPVNNNSTNASDTNLLLNESHVKPYTKNYEASYFNKIKQHILNNRTIKSLPKGAIGFIAGASIGFITIEVIELIVFSLISNSEQKSILSNTFLDKGTIFIKLIYTLIYATIGYYMELENSNTSNVFSVLSSRSFAEKHC